jgi:hypothetical protein
VSDAASLLAKLNANERTVKTLRAIVSAYREDGTVNLAYGAARLYGIPCLAAYTNRKIGDVVQVLDLGANAWLVLGRSSGKDSAFISPTTQNVLYQQYYLDTLISRGTTEPGYEGYVGSSGTPSERPLALAWSYYNGSSNLLTGGVAGKTSLTVTVARASTLHGQREAVEMQLCPHNYNTLPGAFDPLVLDTASFSPVIFRLEIGEIRNLVLPSDWFAAISAGTPTIKGFAILPGRIDPWQSGYSIFSATSGGFRAS